MGQSWHCACSLTSVGANDFTDLTAWQLAERLRLFMKGITSRPAVARSYKYCAQANDAAESAPRNIAEGFGRFAPRQNASFVRIAIASEFETKNHILKVAADGLITATERDAGVLLTHRASTAAIRYRKYLRSTRAEENAKRIEQRQMENDEPLNP
jgi:four helix bundle protein